MKRRVGRWCGMSFDLVVDAAGWHAHLDAFAAERARAGSGDQGQRLRLRPRPTHRRVRPADVAHASPSASIRRRSKRSWLLLRGRAGDDAVAPVFHRPRPWKRAARPTGDPHDQSPGGHRPPSPKRGRRARSRRHRRRDVDRPARVRSPRTRRRGRRGRPRSRSEGFGIHLPLMPTNLAEADRWAGQLLTSQLETTTFYVSHLTPGELAELRERRPELDIRARIGTALWLGHSWSRCRVRATVLDVHRSDPWRADRLPPTGNAGAMATCWCCLAGRATGSGSKRRARSGRRRIGPSDSPAAAWRRPASPSARSSWPASSAGSPNHRTCSPAWCSCRTRSTPPEPGDTVSAAVRYTTTTFDVT